MRILLNKFIQIFILSIFLYSCLLDGEKKVYYENGQIKSIKNFKNGELHGEVRYFYENGQVESVRNYFKGKLHGSVKRYRKDGSLERLIQFRRGKQHGTTSIYFKNGNIAKLVEWEHGLRSGKEVLYYQNGNIEYEGVNHNDNQDSMWVYYNEKGKVLKKIIYSHGDILEVIDKDSIK